MRFIFYYIACSFLLTIIYTGNTSGQITGDYADKVVVTSKIHADTSIHVFYHGKTGSLNAKNPFFPAPATFSWTEFKTAINDFDNTSVSSDTFITGKPSGGYKVRISSAGVDSIYVAWIFIDSLSVRIDQKDINNDLSIYSYSCDYTVFQALLTQSPYIYYDSKNKKQTLPGPTYFWSSDHPLRNFTSDDSTQTLRMDTTKGMPYEKAKFFVHVEDKFGAISNVDSVNYTPVVTKAKIDTTASHPVYEKINSAPFTVTFLNKSKNGVRFVWKFSEIKTDTVRRNDTTKVVHTFPYTSPRDTVVPYKVFLISQSLQQCVDTARINISISPGDIEKGDSLPNYFTPEGNNYKKFRIYNLSIRQFRFTVFSRWGKKVYEAQGPNMLEWDGWNGNIGNSGREASAGIYYYVLEVISWDKVPDAKHMKTNGKYSGFFYLFR